MDQLSSLLGDQRILVLAPHADDETYGCAGTIAKNYGCRPVVPIDNLRQDFRAYD